MERAERGRWECRVGFLQGRMVGNRRWVSKAVVVVNNMTSEAGSWEGRQRIEAQTSSLAVRLTTFPEDYIRLVCEAQQPTDITSLYLP